MPHLQYLLRMMNNQLNIIPSNIIHSDEFDRELDFGCLGSHLRNLAGKKVLFRSDFSKESIPLQSFTSSECNRFLYAAKDFGNHPRDRTIVSIDSSCALIGETEEGAIYAGRVTTVQGTKYGIQTFCRAGPVIFYLDPSAAKSKLCSGLPRRIFEIILMD